jgi:hypothetical protein
MRSAANPNGIVMIRTKQIRAASRYPNASHRPPKTNQMIFRISRIFPPAVVQAYPVKGVMAAVASE